MANPVVYGLPSKHNKKLIGVDGKWNKPAVVYPASEVGSEWPVPTWNLRTPWRHTLQTAGKLPAELSAIHRAGKFRFAMMGDQSLRKG